MPTTEWSNWTGNRSCVCDVVRPENLAAHLILGFPQKIMLCSKTLQGGFYNMIFS